MTSEFNQIEMLTAAVTTLTNNQMELVNLIKTCGERINILVERADIHMNIIEDLQEKIKMIEAIQTQDQDEFDSHVNTGRALSLARKARQRDDS